MSKVPDHLRRAVTEGSRVAEILLPELMLQLVDAVEEQTAVQDDTLHGELVRIREAQEQTTFALRDIGGELSELTAVLRGGKL